MPPSACIDRQQLIESGQFHHTPYGPAGQYRRPELEVTRRRLVAGHVQAAETAAIAEDCAGEVGDYHRRARAEGCTELVVYLVRQVPW